MSVYRHCLKSICSPDCSCYSEQAKCICDSCSLGIFAGEEYALIGDATYHIACLKDMDTRELLRMCGVLTEIESEDCHE